MAPVWHQPCTLRHLSSQWTHTPFGLPAPKPLAQPQWTSCWGYEKRRPQQGSQQCQSTWALVASKGSGSLWPGIFSEHDYANWRQTQIVQGSEELCFRLVPKHIMATCQACFTTHHAGSAAAPGLYGNVLRARALWLIGVCGGELQPASWAEAFSLAVQHIQAPDLVVREVGSRAGQ